MTIADRCPVCGATDHKTIDTAGITTSVCKSVPLGYVWVDQAYKTGPRGALFEIKADAK